ncbi:MAG TPA: LLM class flavin-dependent oxidoreductase [Methylomirabilota bacterium]|nr:LLM class flavin-dependent oxidoreductase [Methylomirabilota bacterium]
MPLGIGLMIEGQEGLTWERWRRLARAAEEGGFESLFRSDHLTGLFGDSSRPALDTWASLTWLATATTRIRFGPMVCPLTFDHPALLARRAAAVAELAGGRLDLGIGAGWHEGEHAMFGIPFPPLRERMDRLECGARAIRALWQGQPVTLEQPYYPLRAAESHPRPPGGRVPLIIGGRGEKRALRIIAEHADEWNVTRVTVDEYAAKRAVLEAHGKAVGRDAGAIRRSLMIPVIVGRTPAECETRHARARTIFPRVPADAAEWRSAGFLYGTPAQVADDLRRWERAGMARVMLQMLDMEDLGAIELLAREVVPACR